MMKLNLFICLLFISTISATAKDIYVNAAIGNDTAKVNDGATPLTALKSINMAVALAQNGDVILIEGINDKQSITYYESVVVNEDVPNIVFRGVNNPIISGKDNKSPENVGILILNNDDVNLKKLKTHSRVITYGITQSADIMATNIKTGPGYQRFDLISERFQLKTTLTIKVPGLFNIYNFLAAIAGVLALGASTQAISEVAKSFIGIWRRFEVHDLKIEHCKLKIVSDYAHHPTAEKDTIKAAQEFFPGRRVVAVFQPHHHNRTKRLFNDFVDGFQGAEVVIISEIYDVAGREESDDQNISSKDLVQAIKNKYPLQEIFYTPDLIRTKQKLLSLIQPNDVVLVMGAGDIYTIF